MIGSILFMPEGLVSPKAGIYPSGGVTYNNPLWVAIHFIAGKRYEGT